MNILMIWLCLLYIVSAISYSFRFFELTYKTYYDYLGYLIFGVITIPISIIVFVHKQLSKKAPTKDDFKQKFDKIFLKDKD